MSSTRWESSQRPLFVKSVWTNGYRHAILTKEDPVAKRKPSSSNRLRSSKQNSARAKLKSSDSSDSSSLVIPAVQLLLADVHHLNRTENEKQYPERKKLVKSITFNVISRQYSPIHVKNNCNNFELDDFTPSSRHISLSYNLNNNSSQMIERIKSERVEQSSSSLTERVLLWLDLAGRFSNEYSSYNNNNIEDDNKKTRNIRTRDNKRIATAYPSYSEKTAQFSTVNHSNVFVRKCTKNIHFIANNHDSDIDLSFENEDDYSILKEPRKIQNDQLHYQNHQIVTSQVEDFSDDLTTNSNTTNSNTTTNSNSNCKSSDNNEQFNKNFTQDLSKRQVHIFMPIMKKNFENNSVISCSTNASM